jgi:hypothetical protein
MSSGTLRLGASVARLVETRQPFFGAAHAPFRRRAGRAFNLASNRPAGRALRRHQHDASALPQPVLSLGRARPLIRRQNNSDRFRDAVHSAVIVVMEDALFFPAAHFCQPGFRAGRAPGDTV